MMLYIVIFIAVVWLFIRWVVVYTDNHCDICGHHWREHVQPDFDGCSALIIVSHPKRRAVSGGTWNQRCRCLAVHRLSLSTRRQMIGRWMLLLRHRPVLVEKED